MSYANHASNLYDTAAYPQHERVPLVARLPLRVSLTIGCLILLFIGIVASNVFVATAQWNTSMNALATDLKDARYGWAAHPGALALAQYGYGDNVHDPRNRHHHDDADDADNADDTDDADDVDELATTPPSHFFLSLTFPDGATEIYNDNRALPDVSSLPVDDTIHEVTSEGPGPTWRAIRYPVDLIVGWDSPAGPHIVPGVATLALPMDAARNSLQRLITLQVLVGLIILTLAGGLSWLLVNSALAPLQKVEDAAADIATGDYSRRVPLTGYNTEVESLGYAFNRMASQVQNTFAERAASENRARLNESSMRRFVGDASHELRTPLTAVRGFADAAQMGAIDTATALDRISEESSRMQVLVEDLLLLARIDNDRPFDLSDITEVDLGTLLTNAVDAARVSWPDREISLLLPEDGIAVGDETRLRQVVDNLITNSLRHAGADAQVRVGLRIDHDHDNALIMVSDNGVGMDAETTAHVFDRFFRGDNSRARDTGDRTCGRGSGLGLSIVKSLVESHRGTVTVASSPGAGTQFVVTLPLAVESDD